LEHLSQDFLLSPDPAEWREHRVLALAQTPSLQDILDWYERYHGDFNHVEEALRRRRSQLSTNPRDPTAGPNLGYKAFLQTAYAYVNLCEVHLLLNDPDAALNDLTLLRRLADVVQASEPPNLVEAMTKVAIVGLFAQTVEDTLAEGLWTETNLQAIQKLCTGDGLLQGLAHSLRGERAGILRVMQNAAKGSNTHFADIFELDPWQRLSARISPKGWNEQNYASYARLIQVQLQGYDAFVQHSDVRALENGNRRAQEEMERKLSYYHPYYFFAAIAMPDFAKAPQRTAEAQTLLDEAYVACALERYRAAHGSYPETLAALTPGFAAKLPYDLFDRQSLRYQRLAPGNYRLYSIGWNTKDDGGEIAHELAGSPPNGRLQWRDDKGDWVWRGVPSGKQNLPDRRQMPPATVK